VQVTDLQLNTDLSILAAGTYGRGVWETSISPDTFGPGDVLTWHNDNLRSGANLRETTLNPGNVNPDSFGKLFTYLVDGYVYAQPLYMSQVVIPGQGIHNVVFVATEHDSIYALDAEGNGGPDGPLLWRTSLIDPVNGVTSVPSADTLSSDIVPEIGITGTPVIDQGSNTLYVVAKTKEIRDSTAHYVLRLHALDVTTGNEKRGILIGDTTFDGTNYTNATPVVVPGTGAGSEGGQVAFNALRQNQRAALSLASGIVYVAFASHGGNGPYHGWVLGYGADDLQLGRVVNTSPNAYGAGIWQSGAGLTVDEEGNLFFAAGAGPFDLIGSEAPAYGDSVLWLAASGAITAFHEENLGSGGPVLLPAQPVPGCGRFLVQAGQQGTLHLLTTPGLIPVQILPNALAGVWGSPASYDNTVYFQGSDDSVKAFRLIADPGCQLTATPVVQSASTIGYPGATPSLSADGTNMLTAIVWTLQNDDYSTPGPAVLHAYRAADLVEVYRSDARGLRDQLGDAVKFTVPTVTHGHVYVGSAYSISAFGLLPQTRSSSTAAWDLAFRDSAIR
jgi:hypothetical protein